VPRVPASASWQKTTVLAESSQKRRTLEQAVHAPVRSRPDPTPIDRSSHLSKSWFRFAEVQYRGRTRALSSATGWRRWTFPGTTGGEVAAASLRVPGPVGGQQDLRWEDAHSVSSLAYYRRAPPEPNMSISRRGPWISGTRPSRDYSVSALSTLSVSADLTSRVLSKPSTILPTTVTGLAALGFSPTLTGVGPKNTQSASPWGQ
jgi:hypothetical protein